MRYLLEYYYTCGDARSVSYGLSFIRCALVTLFRFYSYSFRLAINIAYILCYCVVVGAAVCYCLAFEQSNFSYLPVTNLSWLQM